MNAQTKVKPPATNVYAKIAAVQAELAKVGISKSRKNQTPGQNYNFRGIDEVYNTLAPMMADHGLCILPRIVEHSLTERGKTSKGNTIWSAIVTAEFDFVSADDGSIHVVRTMGEAMDSSDKATNKAMSAAYKYAALMTFAIPTEGDNDADAHTPEVVAQNAPPKREAWDTPIPNKSALHKALTRLERELAGCGDSDMVYALTATRDWRDFVTTAEKHAPHYLRGGEPAPPEFEGLQNTAERMVREFDAAEANHMVDLARA